MVGCASLSMPKSALGEGTRSVCEVSQSLDGCLGRVRAGWSSSWQAGNWTEYGVIYKVMLKRLKILGV